MKTIVFTLVLLAYLYFLISPKEPLKVFPSLALIVALIASCVYYTFVKKSDFGFGKISTPLLSSFIGLFLALYVNGSYNYKRESEIYKLLLINTQLEIYSNLSVLEQTEEALKDPIKRPINALTNSIINNTVQNPIFLRHANAIDLISLNLIDEYIMVCSTYLDSMLTGKLDYGESKSIFSENTTYLKLMMVTFTERNKEIYNRFVGELEKQYAQELKDSGIGFDYKHKY